MNCPKNLVETWGRGQKRISVPVRYSFLLVSNMFCDLSLLLWPLFRAVRYRGVWEGGECGKKNLLRWALEAHVHKTICGPLIYTAPGQVQEGVGPWTSRHFLGPKFHSHNGSMPFHRAQKSLDFQGPNPLALVMDSIIIDTNSFHLPSIDAVREILEICQIKCCLSHGMKWWGLYCREASCGLLQFHARWGPEAGRCRH